MVCPVRRVSCSEECCSTTEQCAAVGAIALIITAMIASGTCFAVEMRAEEGDKGLEGVKDFFFGTLLVFIPASILACIYYKARQCCVENRERRYEAL